MPYFPIGQLTRAVNNPVSISRGSAEEETKRQRQSAETGRRQRVNGEQLENYCTLRDAVIYLTASGSASDWNSCAGVGLDSAAQLLRTMYHLAKSLYLSATSKEGEQT